MHIFKKMLCLPGFFILADAVFGQTDSLKSLELNQVTIQSNGNDKQFNFYQSSKLATTEEILGRMDGVNLIRRSAYGMEPILRNYSAGQITLSIDGMRIYGACTDKMDPVSIYVEPINLHGINATAGAQGNFTGSSIGGNINMKFKEPDVMCHTQYHTQFSQSYNTNNQAISSNFAVEKSGVRNGFRLSGVYRKANNYSSPDSVIKNSAYEKTNFSFAFRQVIDSGNQIKFYYLGDWGRNIGFPSLPMDVGNADANIFSLSHLYSGKSSVLLMCETKIYFNSIYHNMDDTHRENIAMHMEMPGWSKTAGVYNESTIKLRKSKIQSRFDMHQNQMQSDMTMFPSNGDPVMYMQTLPGNKFQNMGFAFQLQRDITVKYFMKWNGRMDYARQFALQGIGADQWSGMGYDVQAARVNFLKSFSWIHGYMMSKGLSQNFILSYAERLPGNNERYGFYLFNPMDNYDYIGNPDLKCEKSYQIEYVFKQDFKKIQWSFQPYFHHTLDYIYSKILNFYYPMTAGAKGVKTYQNISYANSFGAEGSIIYRFTDRLQYRANLKCVYAQNDNGVPLPLVTPLKLLEIVKVNFNELQFQLEHQFSAAQNRINTDFGERSTPSFHLFNLRCSKSMLKNKHTFQLAIALENIFNLSYHEHLDIGYIPRMGRNLAINLTYIQR